MQEFDQRFQKKKATEQDFYISRFYPKRKSHILANIYYRATQLSYRDHNSFGMNACTYKNQLPIQDFWLRIFAPRAKDLHV